jgi:hypothetical protein
MLRVARRFAIAYMPYQVGRLPAWARTTILRTCTPAFAGLLLDHPARLPAEHAGGVETYAVVSVNLLAGADLVAVSFVSHQDSADTGAFVLRLVSENGRWLVAGLGA